jgi:predicted nucleic acid-binding protein
MFPDAGRSRRHPLVIIESGCVILVDTSVWIRFFANRARYVDRLDALLDRGEAAGHELIYGELLIGGQGGRAKFLASYERMYQASMVPHSVVVAFVRARKLHGRGLGWIDVHLLASALVGRLRLWTADQSLAAVARELGIAWGDATAVM